MEFRNFMSFSMFSSVQFQVKKILFYLNLVYMKSDITHASEIGREVRLIFNSMSYLKLGRSRDFWLQVQGRTMLDCQK